MAHKRLPNMTEKKAAVYCPGFVDEQNCFEQATGPKGETGFAVYYEQDNEVRFEETVTSVDGDKDYLPLDHPLWPLAKFPEGYRRIPSVVDPKAVLDLVRDYIYTFVELPYDELNDIFTLWNMASYLIDKWESTPYLCFIGPPDSGKTRALEVAWQLSYRGILSPSFTSSALFRTVEKYKPTLLLDEAEIYGSEQKAEIIGILNAGYRKGQYVLRVNMESGDCDTFSPFGFKGLAQTNIFVPTIESRSINIHMRRNVRDCHVFYDKDKAASLRLMLLLYRFNVLREKQTIMNDATEILKFLPCKHGRIAELFYALVAISPNDEIRQKISRFAQDTFQKRLDDEKATIEAEVVKAVLACKEQVDAGKLTIQAITNEFNLGKPEKQQWKSESIGRRLKQMGFSKTRITHGLTAIVFDESLVEYLSRRYGYTPENPSLPSLPSPFPSMVHTNKSEGSEGSEGFLGVSPPPPITLDDLASVYWKEEFSRRTCGICGYEKETAWEAVTHKAQVIPICEDCVNTFNKKQGA
jgi:hypothetical protein